MAHARSLVVVLVGASALAAAPGDRATAHRGKDAWVSIGDRRAVAHLIPLYKRRHRRRGPLGGFPTNAELGGKPLRLGGPEPLVIELPVRARDVLLNIGAVNGDAAFVVAVGAERASDDGRRWTAEQPDHYGPRTNRVIVNVETRKERQRIYHVAATASEK